jgi:hypothetical protein
MPVFISHVEENKATAEAVARGLRAHGYEPWAYETDTVPGPTYLSQVVDAIEQATAMILVISPASLGSHQVAREIEVAHELDKPIIPVLLGITQEKYVQRRPDWRLALGAYTSIAVPPEGVDAIVSKIVAGLQALGVVPGQPPAEPPPTPATTTFGGAPASEHRRKRAVLAIAALAVIVLIGIVTVLVVGSGGDTETVGPAGTDAPAPTDGPDGADSGAVAGLEATLDVTPTTVGAGGVIDVAYSLTNASDQPIAEATTEIMVIVAPNVEAGGLVLRDLSQDIAPGATVDGSFTGDLLGASLGEQQVIITVGRRIAGGSVDVQAIAEVPITIDG